MRALGGIWTIAGFPMQCVINSRETVRRQHELARKPHLYYILSMLLVKRRSERASCLLGMLAVSNVQVLGREEAERQRHEAPVIKTTTTVMTRYNGLLGQPPSTPL